ncbi:DNA ligase 1-like [Senna tora]|uniref:DNA ligase 1-like n=1 Tax=Senna tora TaxID=362788 RepID=A0A834SCQ9_9FABA|nr:DNA ligase 1-like [Senna tora]
MPPFTDFEIALLNRAGCAPSMMMPYSWTLVGGFEALCNFHRVEATVEAFFYFFQMNFPQKGSWFYFQARGRGPHAKKLFWDLRDPPKDWKKDFFLVRPRRGCQPTWWFREDGSPLFPTKWVEPFEETVKVLSALPPGLDIDDYFITDENGGKFNPARILALTKREEAKHGKSRSADRSGSSSAHHSKPRGDPRDEDPKKGHGKGHSSHSGSKGKVSVSIGSKASGLPSHKRRHGKDAELRSPSPKRAKCEEGVEKEKALLAAEKELEQLRPEVASLRSSEQLLKVQLENAQKELKVWKDRSSALDEENKALRRAKESAVDGQRKLVADHSSLMGEYESLLQKFREASSENAQLEDALEEEREAVKALASDCSAEPSEGPRVEPSIKEAEAAESKPGIISEEFANSILAD